MPPSIGASPQDVPLSLWFTTPMLTCHPLPETWTRMTWLSKPSTFLFPTFFAFAAHWQTSFDLWTTKVVCAQTIKTPSFTITQHLCTADTRKPGKCLKMQMSPWHFAFFDLVILASQHLEPTMCTGCFWSVSSQRDTNIVCYPNLQSGSKKIELELLSTNHKKKKKTEKEVPISSNFTSERNKVRVQTRGKPSPYKFDHS